MPVVVIVHAFGGHPLRYWYLWLVKSLQDLFPRIEVKLLKMTDPHVPKIDVWLDDVRRAVSESEQTHEKDSLYLIGHSVGCQTCIRFLASPETPELLQSLGFRVGGVVCAGAWFSVNDPWETILPWCTEPIDSTAARLTLGAAPLRVFISDNDRYTPDYKSNAEMWRAEFGGVVHVLPGRAHFSSKRQPEILECMCEMLAKELIWQGQNP